MSDLDVLKEIPGYKAILKSVLKSQIQLLMEQLSEHTGEESIILTASVNDGSLSHLGSNTGKGFLEGRDEIKSQFLGYCLKTYHKQKTHEPQKPYQRTHPSPRSPAQMPTPPAKRPRVQPVSLSRASPAHSYTNPRMPMITQKRFPSDAGDSSSIGLGSGASLDSVLVKTEQVDNERTNTTETKQTEPELSEPSFTTANVSIPESVHLSHTQTSVDSSQVDVEMDSNHESKQEIDETEVENAGSSGMTSIKIEQVDDEFEITGVEMAAGALDNWGQDQSGFGIEGDGSFDQSADQSGYKYGVFEDSVSQLEDRAPSLDRVPAGHFNTWKITRSTSSSHARHLTDSSSTRQTGSSSGLTDTIMDNLINATTDRSCITYPEMESGQCPRPVGAGSRLHHEEYAAMKKHQPKLVYACEFCGQIYYQRQHLTRHYSVHTGERLFKCSVCGKDFRLKHHLKEHIVLVHKKAPSETELFIVMKK